MRARELGIEFGVGTPGPNNAITDVPGVRVGHTTLIVGDGPSAVRTGVTVVLPHPDVGRACVFAGCHRLNGNGELTGLEWVRESGLLTAPIGITNTYSVGVVRDAFISVQARNRPDEEVLWSLPVVGETSDGLLNDINGMHVRPEHVWSALDGAGAGPVQEGNVGGGTGMICHGFKGGIGTASRVMPYGAERYTVGVLVQANQGKRERLTIAGMPVGRLLPTSVVPAPELSRRPPRTGSIIVVVGTDAPLLPHQCTRLAQRAGLGIGRVGGVGEHASGDLFLAFATGNADTVSLGGETASLINTVRQLDDQDISQLYDAVVDATEESIANALVAAETMVGRNGNTAHALPADRLREFAAAYRQTASRLAGT